MFTVLEEEKGFVDLDVCRGVCGEEEKKKRKREREKERRKNGL